MDATNDQYFHCFCRACMYNLTEDSYDVNIKSEQQWKSVVDPVEECGALGIAELLSITVPQIQVQINDELPKKICHECLQKLLSFHRFQKMCIQSDRHIRELIVRRKAQCEITTKLTVEDTRGTNVPDQFKGNDCAINETPHNFQGLFLTTLQQQHDFETKEPKIESANSLSEVEQSNAADPLYCNDEIMKNVNGSQGDAIEVSTIEQCNNEKISDYGDSEILKVETGKGHVTSLISPEHICAICEKSFKQLRHLKCHLERHKKWNGQKEKLMQPYRFKCDICSRYFHKARSLHNHSLVHDAKTRNNIVVNACDLCDKTYSSRRTLARHKRMRHAIEKPQKTIKRHVCELCAKSFKNSVALRDHIRTHTGERPYLCPECGKSYSTSGNLRQHRLRHSDDKPYECPYCPMRFPCSSGVTNHKKIHAAKQQICDICGAKFAKSDDLKRHKMHHLGEKPYKCEYCDMRFVRMNHQRRHMRTHTGEKPYKCKYCERAFAQSNDHIKHLRSHLGDNVYRCELCPLAYRLASELRLHFATHKQDDAVARGRNMKALMKAEAELELKIASKGNLTVF